MDGIEIIGEFNASGSQVIRDGIKNVNDIRTVLIVIGSGEMNLQAFRISDTLTNRIDELDQIVNLR